MNAKLPLKIKRSANIVNIDSKSEKWKQSEVKKAYKLFSNKIAKILKTQYLSKDTISKLLDKDLNVMQNIMLKECERTHISIQNMKVPSRYQNNKIYIDMLDALKDGWKSGYNK